MTSDTPAETLPPFGVELPACTRADLLDVQANILDAISVLEAKHEELVALVTALVSSAEQASTMAATVMQGGLGALLRGQK